MAKRVKPPPVMISIDFSDCGECIRGVQCKEHPTLFYCDKSLTPQPNCLERKIACVYYMIKNNEGDVIL